MKKLLVILICLFVFSETKSSEDSIEGKMNCVIKDNVVKNIIDGNVSTFTGIKGKLSTGDSFELSYKFISPSSFAFKTSGDYFRTEMLFNLKEPTIFNINKKYQYIVAMQKLAPSRLWHEKVELRRDKITVSYDSSPIITLNRYYKSDWEGTIVQASNLTNLPIRTVNLFFDCKHTSKDNYTKVFESLINLKP